MSKLELPNSPAWPVYGHTWAVDYLQRIVDTDRVDGRGGPRHAYLFAGPPQVGKSTVVRAFAQALLCTGKGTPCGECRSCQLMVKEQHPDFRLVPPTDSDGNVDRTNGMLRAEAAAELIHEAALRPVEGRYKVFLIQDAHLANPTFSNKILKTLEEPPAHVIICVTATGASELLPTIVSRCEVIELRPLSVAAARDGLVRGWQVDPARAELLARLCNGRLGWAVRQIADETGTAARNETLAEISHLVGASRIERLRFAEVTAANRDNLRLFNMLELWITWWRDVLLAQHGCINAISNLDHQAEIEQHARELTVASVQGHLEMLRRVESYLHHTVNTRLAMDALLLDVPRPAA